MVIMALDHVREFYSYTLYRADDVTQTSVLLFFTRWITHVCAPTFVFLSGMSIYLYSKKIGDLRKTSIYLLTRGLWLIGVEVCVISFILTQGYNLTLLEVIWAIGCSMILLAGLIWLPRWIQIILSLGMLVGHDAISLVGKDSSNHILDAFLHNTPFFVSYLKILVAYAIVPWVGVMLLGFVMGSWFTQPPQVRRKFLLRSGWFALILFVSLRFLNLYGDPAPWSFQVRGSVYTLLSFLKVSKSPPSLLFLSVTLGTAFLLLAKADEFSDRFKKILMTFGRVPFFFFVIHLAIISLTSYLWTYFSFGKGINLSFTPSKDWPIQYEPSLIRTYFLWLFLVIFLYFPCRWFGNWKSKTKTWWVSYL